MFCDLLGIYPWKIQYFPVYKEAENDLPKIIVHASKHIKRTL